MSNSDDNTEAAKPDLSSVTSQELIDELRGRCAVFACAFRLLSAKLPEEWRLSYSGDVDRVIGLLALAQNDMLNPAPDEADDGE